MSSSEVTNPHTTMTSPLDEAVQGTPSSKGRTMYPATLGSHSDQGTLSKGPGWQRLHATLYNAEHDFVVTDAHAQAIYPDVQLDFSLSEAYRGIMDTMGRDGTHQKATSAEGEVPAKPTHTTSSGVNSAATTTKRKRTSCRRYQTGTQSSSTMRNRRALKERMRRRLTEKTRAVKHKKERTEKLQRELKVEPPPAWAFGEGPVRVAREKRDLENRIKRYRGELKLATEQHADLEKSRIIFKALDHYYSDRHGDNKKFLGLVADGYTDPVQVVAHFWQGESTVVRNALFSKCAALSAKLFRDDPSKLRQWLNAFDTVEAFNEFFNISGHDERLRLPVYAYLGRPFLS